ncbi:Sel1 domain-containing protein [Herbaspirillum frisingense GSF30]|uniref:Sel1 domain-containing protein n=2 Tax=Herbaspirillum frisingense TaxID=92645 RepID=A0AAI9N4V7_9BURK|nr:Sel1 domain-containing protein [Herbaspirillum frisingense GSF30]
MLNLADGYAHGEGVDRNTERAIQIIEEAMRMGIPAAFNVMGRYHMEGMGVKSDPSRAYAFLELAADMGSASAQAFIGKALRAVYDDPAQGFWGNRKIGIKMMECGFQQGNREAAYALGLSLIGRDSAMGHDMERALVVLHDSVKLGSDEGASYLSLSFSVGRPLVGGFKDPTRADRYSTLAAALRIDPDLRFPNLDKILPLPPAKLPMWNGDRNTLLDAAKPILPRPAAPPPPEPNPAWLLTGRAHIEPGRQLPEQPQRQIVPQYESTAAPETGYWIARLMHPVSERHRAWDAQQLPMRYLKGELFDRSRTGLQDEDGRIRFHYLGEAIDQLPPAPIKDDPRLARRAARYSDIPKTERYYRSHSPCPRAGIWRPYLPDTHPLHASFNRWDRQAYVRKGMPFPAVVTDRPGIEEKDILWQWLANANEVHNGLEHVTLTPGEDDDALD